MCGEKRSPVSVLLLSSVGIIFSSSVNTVLLVNMHLLIRGLRRRCVGECINHVSGSIVYTSSNYRLSLWKSEFIERLCSIISKRFDILHDFIKFTNVYRDLEE